MTRRKSIGKSFRSRSQKAKRDEECEEDEEDEEEEEECAEVVKTLYKEFSQLSLDLFRTEKRRQRVSRIKKEESEGELTKIGSWILEV